MLLMVCSPDPFLRLNDLLFRGKSIADVVDQLNSKAEEDALKEQLIHR